MKYKILILSFLISSSFSSVYGQQDLVNSFFEKYSESEYVTSIFISPRFFNSLYPAGFLLTFIDVSAESYSCSG